MAFVKELLGPFEVAYSILILSCRVKELLRGTAYLLFLIMGSSAVAYLWDVWNLCKPEGALTNDKDLKP